MTERFGNTPAATRVDDVATAREQQGLESEHDAEMALLGREMPAAIPVHLERLRDRARTAACVEILQESLHDRRHTSRVVRPLRRRYRRRRAREICIGVLNQKSRR